MSGLWAGHVLVESGQICISEMGDTSAVATEIRLVSAAYICPILSAGICHVSKKDFCPAPISSGWLFFGDIRADESYFDPCVTPKIGEMKSSQEHYRRGPGQTRAIHR